MARIQSFTVIGTRNIISSRLLTVGLFWAAVILGLDLLSPASVASGVPYGGLILLGLWLPQRWYILIAAITGTMYDKTNIGQILDMRNFMDTLRGSGVETGGPDSFGQRERMKFANELDRFIARR